MDEVREERRVRRAVDWTLGGEEAKRAKRRNRKCIGGEKEGWESWEKKGNRTILRMRKQADDINQGIKMETKK